MSNWFIRQFDRLILWFFGNGTTKGFIYRSAVQLFTGTLLTVVLFAWSKNEAIVEAIKKNSETLVPGFLLAVGITTGNPSKR